MPLVNPYISFPAATGSQFFVSPAGDDGDPGTEAEPWATFDFAVAQLVAGDTLIAEGGTYYESGIVITENGTAEAPITIEAKTGETPILDGSLSAYRTEPNSAWEVHDAGRNIYRTVDTLPDPGEFGYTGRIDVDGTLYMLTSYNDTGVATGLASLSADDDLFDPLNAYYMGPGIAYNTGRVYIRLEPNSDAAQWVGDPVGEAPFVISELDPREHAIFIQSNSTGIAVDGDWVTVDGIDLRHHWTAAGGTGTDVTVKNLTMHPSRFGGRIDGDRWTFDNVVIDFHLSPWIARSDVKSAAEPAKDTRTGGISWEFSSGGTLSDSTIRGAFDANLVLGNNVGISILNCVLENTQDDACQLGSAAYDFEFGYNFVTGAGISHDGSGSDAADTPDSVYVHHNVFDNTIPVFWARKPIEGVDPSENGDGGYLSPPCIGSHATPTFDDPWKVYNNTFVAAAAPGIQGVNHYAYHGTTPGEGMHEAYNNILNLQDSDTRVYRNANAGSGLEDFDYNIYARQTPLGQFAIESVDSAGDPVAVTADFATWQTDMGWDTNSIHQTTQVALNGSYQPAIGGPADGNGLDLSGTGWPGTTPGTDWIGAKAPV